MSTEDDVSFDKNLAIVDCDVLEAAKENVQPLASGRRVTALSTLLSTPHAQREAKLSATRNRLRINVEIALDDGGDDLLEAYCRLVYWTVENYPQGHSAESGLLELLEEATRVLKDDGGGRWKADVKYLKLWLLYASFVENPTIIYRFLIANEIGATFALLYEEYAAVLEQDGRRKDADEAYLLGIARRASPLEHLQCRHSDFQKRMMSNSLLAPTPLAPPPSRPVLATSALASGTLPTRISPLRDGTSIAPAAARPASSKPLPIFVDPIGSQSGTAEAATNTWTELSTRKMRIKENAPEVKKLAGTTLKQAGRSKRIASSSISGTSSAASGSKIVPYRDPGLADTPPPSASVSKQERNSAQLACTKTQIIPFVDCKEGLASEDVPAKPMLIPYRDEETITSPMITTSVPESVMKVKRAGMKGPDAPSSEAEALRKDPLKNYPEADLGIRT